MLGHGLRRAAAIAVAIASIVLAARAGATSDRPDVASRAGELVAASGLPPELVPVALGRPSAPGSLPVMPRLALRDSVRDLSLLLGAPVSAQSLSWADEISDPLAGRLAIVLAGVAQCHRASSQALSGISPDLLGRLLSVDSPSTPPYPVYEIRACAAHLFEATEALKTVASSEEGPLPEVDLWPVLRIESEGSDTTYLHDYALILDFGGDDTYLNNAGGNLLDLKRGPEGSVALLNEPARGCALIVPHFAPAADCSISSAVLIDLSGSDVYGAMDTPEGISDYLGREVVTQVRGESGDADCTNDLLVRRMVTEGSGLAGVGILRDAGGNDTYLARTLSQGSGHAGGVGILYDTAADSEDPSNDHYRAIRNAQGFGLAGGIGILRDEDGDDLYDFYMPAGDGANKPGGIVSDQLICDNFPRNIQGAGNLGAVGILVNAGGNDRYSSFFGSQGLGQQGGAGIFLELGGTDAYTAGANGLHQPGRENDAQVAGPSSQVTAGLDAFSDTEEI